MFFKRAIFQLFVRAVTSHAWLEPGKFRGPENSAPQFSPVNWSFPCAIRRPEQAGALQNDSTPRVLRQKSRVEYRVVTSGSGNHRLSSTAVNPRRS